QGYFVAYHKIPSFIVTLSGMLVFRGLTLFVMTASGTGTIIGPFPPAFQLISIGFLPNAFDMGGNNHQQHAERHDDDERVLQNDVCQVERPEENATGRK
ncbi:hypothetical protein ACC703_38225, partial [Rhizobium ruizarguesonis]